MSLDVYLKGKIGVEKCICSRCGNAHIISEPEDLYWSNITHNLGHMASEAGIYEAVWRPEELGITIARQLIEPLRAGIVLLKSDPERFKKFNPENGWGDYYGFVHWLENYLQACEANPEGSVHVSR
jgi:hypothetical protein